MRKRALIALLFLTGIAASSSASAQDWLCDASAENCRTHPEKVGLLELINNETQAIDVGVWFFKDDRYITALEAAKKRGVAIRVIMDPRANTTYPANAPLLDRLRAAGIPMRKRIAGDICHWKLMIFVGQKVVEWSGANFSPTAFVPQVKYHDYEDEVIYFSEELLPTFQTMFDNIWTNTREYANYANVPPTLVRNYPTSPLDPRMNFPPKDSYQDRLIPLIDKEPAQGGLIDVQMYRITLARPVDALIRAAARGVRIRLFLEPNEYANTARPGNKVQMDRLVAAAKQYPGTIEIRMRKHLGLNHQKTVWLHAQRVVVFGTSNWSDASDDNQLEANFFSDKLPGNALNAQVFESLHEIFERKWYNRAPDGAIETEAWRTPQLPPPSTDPRCLDPQASNYGGALPCTYPPPPPPPPPPDATTVVLYASKGTITGSAWQVAADTTAAGGAALWNPNLGKAKVAPALATPPSYVELQFPAKGDVAYHMWVRMRAQDNGAPNDSVHVQFSDAVSGAGSTTRVFGIGSPTSAEVILQDGPSGSAPSGWGWADEGWENPPVPIYFAATGTHTLRIQAREDGPFIDQIVFSAQPTEFLTNAPGPRENDITILDEAPTSATPSCSYSLSAAGTSITADGGAGTFNVSAASGCGWTAASNAGWLHVTAGANGSGDGSVSFSVEANPGAARNGVITVNGSSYTVTQAAAAAPACTATLSSFGVTVPAEAGAGNVDVTIDAGCAWTAVSNAPWITVTSGSGTGNGIASFSIDANSGPARTGTLTIAGQTYTLSQNAAPGSPAPSCSVTLDKTSFLVGSAEANWIINVTAPDGTCSWTASADETWLVVKSTFPTAQPVSGSGYVKVRAVINTTGVRRVGHFIINGIVYTVTQGG